jgi:DNA repair protein RadC
VVAPSDADDISRSILAEFGTVARALAETEDAQRRVVHDDRVVGLLAAMRDVMEEGLQADLLVRQVSPTDPALIRYLVATMGSLPIEVLRVLFLDSGRRLLAEEQVACGSVDRMDLYPRTIFKRALEKNAAALILVHNHPGGSAKASDEDVSLTQRLSALGTSLGVAIDDHFIVAGAQCLSMKRGAWL